MTFRVLITVSARGDALSIGRWIASEGAPLAADRWVTELLADLAKLADLPDRHGLAPENVACPEFEIRQRLFGNYRILFTRAGDEVVVFHIRHGRRVPAESEQVRARLSEHGDAVRRDPESGEHGSRH